VSRASTVSARTAAVATPFTKPSKATRWWSIRGSWVKNPNPTYASPTICLVVSALRSSHAPGASSRIESCRWRGPHSPKLAAPTAPRGGGNTHWAFADARGRRTTTAGKGPSRPECTTRRANDLSDRKFEGQLRSKRFVPCSRTPARWKSTGSMRSSWPIFAQRGHRPGTRNAVTGSMGSFETWDPAFALTNRKRPSILFAVG